MKKKILIVSHRWPPRYGGLQNAAFSYAEELANKYAITIYTSKEKKYSNIIPPKTSIVEGNSYPWLYEYLGVPQPIFTISAILKLKEAVKSNDLIIINDRYYISSIFANYFAKKFKKKTLLILQTPVLKYRGILSYFYKLNNFLAKKVVSQADYVFAVSKQTGEDVMKTYKINKSYEVLYNPVNTKEFSKYTKKFKEFTVLFVGRFVSKKGVELLPQIAKKLSLENINVIAVGDGPDFEKVKNAAVGLKNLSLVGKITNRKELVELYKKSHIFLLTSHHGEAFPLVLGDALAAGLPCVSTDGGTFIEIFEKNIGHLGKAGDTQFLAESIIKLKSNSKDYKEKSINSLLFAKEILDIRKAAAKLDKGLQKCLK